MSHDDPGEDLASIFERFSRSSPDRVNKRRQNEARAMSPTTARRGRRTETKTVQINIRVAPSFRKLLTAKAAARGVSLVELIELAVEQLGDA